MLTRAPDRIALLTDYLNYILSTHCKQAGGGQQPSDCSTKWPRARPTCWSTKLVSGLPFSVFVQVLHLPISTGV